MSDLWEDFFVAAVVTLVAAAIVGVLLLAGVDMPRPGVIVGAATGSTLAVRLTRRFSGKSQL